MFRFFCSPSRKHDEPGALLEEVGDDLEELSPVEVRLTSEGKLGEAGLRLESLKQKLQDLQNRR